MNRDSGKTIFENWTRGPHKCVRIRKTVYVEKKIFTPIYSGNFATRFRKAGMAKHIRKYKLIVSGKDIEMEMSKFFFFRKRKQHFYFRRMHLKKIPLLVWHYLVAAHSRSEKWLLSSDREVGYWNHWGFSIPACLTLSLISVLKMKKFDMVL